jgi:uncharacterized membrane protein
MGDRAESSRLDALDVVRGLVIVVMALDHVRDYFSNATFDPVDLALTTPAYFLARWVTHFCAPAFSFFAGTGAFLSLGRGRSERDLAHFLATRGIFLILLEAVVLRFVWTFNLLPFTGLGTLWSLGVAMLVLAFLIRIRLPVWAIAAFGAALVLSHNAFDFLDRTRLAPPWDSLWTALHRGGLIPFGDPAHLPPGAPPLPGLFMVDVAYPLIPWPGVMALGYAFGKILERPREARRRAVLLLGALGTAGFFLLRAWNVYGDPVRFSRQASPLFTALSFLNCEKYPPSLLYLLMTLGPSLVVFSLVDRPPGAFGRFLSVYGRVPMFFYVVHLPVVHALAVVVAGVRAESLADRGLRWAIFESPGFASLPPRGYGFGLAGVTLIWLLVVVSLYPACVWYGKLKAERRARWMSYI